MRNVLKKNTVIVLILAAIFSLTAGFAGVFSTKASAETVTENTFTMIEAAGARLTDPSGIRFMVRVSPDVKDTIENAEEKGFLIFPQKLLSKVTDTSATPNYKDKTVGLPDYVDIPINNGTFYKETELVEGVEVETGYYLANGVMHSVKSQNYELGFTSIAYYKSGDAYVYASFNGDFSRSIYEVLQKSYLYEEENREGIADCFIEGENGWFGTESYPIGITSNEDLTALTEAVAGGETFSGINFKLSENVTVDMAAFTPVASTFAGTFDFNGKILTVQNAGVAEPFAGGTLVDSTDDETVTNIDDDKESLLTVTENVTGRAWVSDGTTSVVTVGSGNEAFKALKIEGTGEDYFYAKVNYTATQLEALSEVYERVSFKVMLETYSTITTILNSDGTNNSSTSTVSRLNLFSKFGYQYSTSARTITTNTWIEKDIALTDMIELLNATSSTFSTEVNNDKSMFCIFRSASINSDTTTPLNVYIGDIKMMTEEDIITATDLLTVTEDNYSTAVGGNSSGSISYVKNGKWSDTIDNTVGYTGNAVMFTKGGNNKNYKVLLNRTYSELSQIDKNIKVRFYIAVCAADDSVIANRDGTHTNNSTAYDTNRAGLLSEYGLTQGANLEGGISKTYLEKNKWVAYDITVEQLLRIMSIDGSATLTGDDLSANAYAFIAQIANNSADYNIYFGDVVWLS